MPAVSTARGESLAAWRSTCDLPVPGSPTRSMCDSPRTLSPEGSACATPPTSVHSIASFTMYMPQSCGGVGLGLGLGLGRGLGLGLGSGSVAGGEGLGRRPLPAGMRCSAARRAPRGASRRVPPKRRQTPPASPARPACGERRWSRRLRRRLAQVAQAPEAVAGHPVGRPLPGRAELLRAARRPEEAQGPSWGFAKAGAL